jgi:hypothetical protein
MKHKITENPEVLFKPVKLEITFESLEELQGVYNILSHTQVLSASGLSLTLSNIREDMELIDGGVYDKESFEEFDRKLKRGCRG